MGWRNSESYGYSTDFFMVRKIGQYVILDDTTSRFGSVSIMAGMYPDSSQFWRSMGYIWMSFRFFIYADEFR